MKSQEIRQSFLHFFKQKGLPTVASSPLVPQGDPTLLFTSAGMVQFKANFLGLKKDLKGAATVQKCLRTTDIDNVGFTKRHLTFFEMLGNFSFGDYFKKEAVEWAWDYLTKTLGISPERLYVSIYKGGIAPRDAEAHAIWAKLVPADRIFELSEKDNFWTMGPTGPCGPCSEIYYDFGPDKGCSECAAKKIECDCGRYVEIWNLVFTQFNRLEDGTLQPLPQKNIDTGMGLERLCMVMQNVDNPFDTDLFAPIITHAQKLLGVKGETDAQRAALRIIAEHIRSSVFLISEGILPSNEGRGYILRRLIRRAARYGKLAGRSAPFLHELVPTVVAVFKDIYPELIAGALHVSNVLRAEGDAFARTLSDGEQRLQELIKKHPKELPGEEAFNLYETYGFPIELTKEILAAQNITVDEPGYATAQERAKNASKSQTGEFEKERVIALQTLEGKHPATVFTGYSELASEAKVVALLDKQFNIVDSIEGEGYLVTDKTPFYANMGGQVGDIGTVEKDGALVARVFDTQKPLEKLFLHKIAVSKGAIKVGDTLMMKVDEVTRFKTASNHTAVHVINAALKAILGPEVRQAGSHVSPERLRFDYTTPAAPTQAQLLAVWNYANDIIAANLKVEMCELPLAKAKDYGATVLLGEKYADPARFVLVNKTGFDNPLERASLELCGGTHVKSTGEIMVIRLIKDGAVSSGVRRIEAMAGLSAIENLKQNANNALMAAHLLGVAPEDIGKKIEHSLKVEKDLRKEVADLRRKLLSGPGQDESAQLDLAGFGPAVAFNAGGTDIKELRALSDNLAAKNPGKIIIVSADNEGKKSFVVKSFANGPDAGKAAKAIAATIGGSGGGRAEFAQGGGPAGNWPDFLAALKNI